MSNNSNKKFKRPKQKTLSTTKPGPSKKRTEELNKDKTAELLCPLAAKDSEWVDIMQTHDASEAESMPSEINLSDVEEVLQLVDCEDGPQLKPLAIMFPDLLEKDPTTLQGVLDRAMSTTEVTRHLVDLGQKANFTFMRKADRLIPKDKKWLEGLAEKSNSCISIASALHISSLSDYDADNEISCNYKQQTIIKKTKDKRANPIAAVDVDLNQSNEDLTLMNEQVASAVNLVIEPATASNSASSLYEKPK